MIEPTETESKEDLDLFVEALTAIVREADENPQLLHDAPARCRVRRMDETEAARHPCLTGKGLFCFDDGCLQTRGKCVRL